MTRQEDLAGPDHPQLVELWVLLSKLLRLPSATGLLGGLLITAHPLA